MTVRNWIRINRAYNDLVTFIKKPYGDDEVIVARTNFVNSSRNFWYVKAKSVTGSHHTFNVMAHSKIIKDNIRTKTEALKIAREYMRSH